MEERYCSNCRTELPQKADSCPSCGVFAGDVFDGKIRKPRQPSSWGFWGAMLIFTIAAAAYAVWMNIRPDPDAPVKPKAPEVRVVRDRPGGARRARGASVTEAEAVRLLRRHIVTSRGLKNECLAVMGNGSSKGTYVFTAYDQCGDVRLGKWRVRADGTVEN